MEEGEAPVSKSQEVVAEEQGGKETTSSSRFKNTALAGWVEENDIPKLTDQKPIDDFWQQPKGPDNEFYLRFREYLIEQTQINGAFYGRSPWMYKYLCQNHDEAEDFSKSTSR